MIPYELWNCIELLVSLICYEVQRDNLSPEMEDILVHHLTECECCRTRFRNFRQLFEKDPMATVQ